MSTTEPSITILLNAAGCSFQSGGGAADGSTWSLRFLTPSRSVVLLKGAASSWKSAEYQRRETLMRWFGENCLTPNGEAIREAMIADAIHGAQHANDLARREHEEVLAALRDLRLATTDRSCIKVWPFNDAPPEFRALSPHGGDEDWLALVPPGMSVPYWMDSGGSFGVCDTSIHEIAGGFTVCIGAHA
jgi:hypothetical protein